MTAELLGHLERTVPSDTWPREQDPLVVAVSGGSDSIALVHLLDLLNKTTARRWRIHVAHLDHGLRGTDSISDARFVTELAQRMEWGWTVDRANLRQLSAATGRSLEDAARQARYQFFERVLHDTGGTVIATAHTADDNVETIIHRMLRGTGLRGLAGIPVVRPLSRGTTKQVIRPLLSCAKADLLKYLETAGHDYREDVSNASLEPLRNRIRQQLLPQLEGDYNPQVRDALLRVGQQCQWWNEYLDTILEKQFGEVALEVGRQHATLSAKALCRLPMVIRMEVIRRATTVIDARQGRLSFHHFMIIAEFATRKVSGKQLELPDGLRVLRNRDKLRFEIARGESQ